MTTSTSPTSSGSSADVTSSKSITCGCIISARAIATRCCWPPESWCGCWLAFSSSPTLARSSRAARLGLPPRDLSDAPCCEREVVQRRQLREEVELLEDDSDALPDSRHVDALARDLLALEEDAPGLDRLEQVDAAKERALAAPARPDDDEHLAVTRRSGRCRRGRGCRRSSCRTASSRTMGTSSRLMRLDRCRRDAHSQRDQREMCPSGQAVDASTSSRTLARVLVVERKEMTMKVAFCISLRLARCLESSTSSAAASRGLVRPSE